MAEQEHRASIRDYLIVLRRRRLLILGAIAFGAIVAFALSLTESKTYTANASLQNQNLSQLAGEAGILLSNQELPQQTGAELAQTATSQPVMTAVRDKLGLKETTDQLRADLSISQDQTSNLVLVQGTASSAQGAATLANTFVDQVAATANKDLAGKIEKIAKQNAAEATKMSDSSSSITGGKNTFSAQEQLQIQAESQQAKSLSDLAAKETALANVVRTQGVAEVTERATVPTSPSSPHPIQNLIIGGIVGLFLGLIASWLVESVDRRLRRPDEAEKVVGLPLVGVLAKGALGTTAADGKGPTDPAMDPFRMIRTNVRFLGEDAEPPRTLLVTSAVPEEGKTTVAIGTALAAASAGMRTLLIEADVHRPVHADRLGLNTTPGLVDYLQGGLTPREVLQTRPLQGEAATSNGDSPSAPVALTCMVAGKSGMGGDAIGSDHFADVLEQVSRVYDFVVIDSAPLLAVAETAQIVPLVDAVVMCVRLGRTTAEQARAGHDALKRLPERPAGLVLTDLTQDLGGYYGYGSYAYGYRSEKDKEKASA